MDKYQKWFWATLGVLTLARLIFIGFFELAPDEAYYWTWSRHLDWAYFDQGPLLAFVIRASTALAGVSNEWSVRMGSVVLSAVSSWLFFALISRAFRSTRAAWYAHLAFQSALLISTGAVLMMHDSIMMCFWLAALYFFYRALLEGWSPGWIGGTAALGLGALAKYSMVFFVPCLLLFLVLSPTQRSWWKKAPLYLAGLGTLVLISPLVIWNLQHDWVSFGHIGDLGGMQKAFHLNLKTLGNFIGGQLGVMSPVLGALCLAAPVLGWRKWKSGGDRSQAFLFFACFSGPILFFFLLMSLRTPVYANWPAPAYPAALAILGGWLISRQDGPLPKIARAWTWATLLLAALMTVTVHLEVTVGLLPLKGNAARSVDRVRGWSVMGQESGRLLAELQAASEDQVFLAARRYQIGSLLSFYTAGQPETQLFPLREPANNQYRFWDQSEELAGRNALFVCEHYWEADHIRDRFERVETLPPFPVMVRGRKIRELRFFFAYGLKPTDTGKHEYARKAAP